MFNLSQASTSTVGPIDTKICMEDLGLCFQEQFEFITAKFNSVKYTLDWNILATREILYQRN